MTLKKITKGLNNNSYRIIGAFVNHNKHLKRKIHALEGLTPLESASEVDPRRKYRP